MARTFLFFDPRAVPSLGKVSVQCRLAFGMALGIMLTPIGAMQADPDEAACRRNLRLIREALGLYAFQHEGAMPSDLGELSQVYLEPDVLRCPAALKAGDTGVGIESLVDPSVYDARVMGYRWELSMTTRVTDSLGRTFTFNEFKRFQMASPAGEWVPIVRCSHHARTLNLTLGGTIYPSDILWEADVVHLVPHPYLAPDLVDLAAIPLADRLRTRPVGASPELIDLRPYCNARFEDPWIRAEWGQEFPTFESTLRNGLFPSGDTEFDASGLIQLNGRPSDQGYPWPHYPAQSKDIPITRSVHRFHILGGVLFSSAPGSDVAYVDLATSDSGSYRSIPWIYGQDVVRFFHETPQPDDEAALRSRIVWRGEATHFERRQRSRLFHLILENPWPDRVVDRLRFRAGNNPSSPFILALTIESPPDPTSPNTAPPSTPTARPNPSAQDR